MTLHKPSEQWQLEGNSAESYERYLVPKMFVPLADYTLDKVGFGVGESLLDAGCGTGIVARRAATQVIGHGNLTGYDVNQGMLDVAKTASIDLNASVEWHLGDLSNMPFSAETFDVAICQQSLQFIPDRVAVLKEIRRVLKHNGRLGLSVWRSVDYQPGFKVLSTFLDEHVGNGAGNMMRSPFPPWKMSYMRDILNESGFRDIHLEIVIRMIRFPSVAGYLHEEEMSSPLAGPLSVIDDVTRQNLIAALEDGLQTHVDDDGLVFPMETYVVTARR